MRRPIGFVPAMLSGFAVTVAALACQPVHAGQAKAVAAAPAPVAAAMACEQLHAELAALAVPAMPVEAPRPRKKKFGLLKALGSAAPILSIATGGVAGMIASSALGTAGSLAGSGDGVADAQRGAAEALMAQAATQQRRAELSAALLQKGC